MPEEAAAGPLLIVGSGPAGLEAARACREAGGDGAVIMISAARTLALEGGETPAYRYCVLATGAAPAPLPVPGGGHPGIRLLRSRRDGADLRQAAGEARSAVVVGSGFIGCDAAASRPPRPGRHHGQRRGPPPGRAARCRGRRAATGLADR